MTDADKIRDFDPLLDFTALTLDENERMRVELGYPPHTGREWSATIAELARGHQLGARPALDCHGTFSVRLES